MHTTGLPTHSGGRQRVMVSFLGVKIIFLIVSCNFQMCKKIV